MRGAGCRDSCHCWLLAVCGTAHAGLPTADCGAVHPRPRQLLPALQVAVPSAEDRPQCILYVNVVVHPSTADEAVVLAVVVRIVA